MAKKIISGADGAVALPTGFNLKFATWSATANYGVADTTGFGDAGYTASEATVASMTGSAFGYVEYDDTSSAPMPALGSTFDPSSVVGAGTITAITGCTYGGDILVTDITFSRSSKPGVVMEATYNFTFTGAITRTWDETGA